MSVELTPDAKASDELAKALAVYLHGKKADTVGTMAYVQGVYNFAAMQAIVHMLKAHNIISDSEISRHLADQYKAQLKRLADSGQILRPQAAVVRPINGG